MKIRSLFPVVALVLCSCSQPSTTDLNADHPDDVVQIQRVLNDVFDAAAKKDFPRLDSYHFYGPKFTKFDDFEPLTRHDAAAGRKAEHDGLGSISDLSVKADGLKIDVFDNVAIATFVLDYGFKAGNDTIRTRARSTLVFVEDQGAWKIAHEHFSAFKSNP